MLKLIYCTMVVGMLSVLLQQADAASILSLSTFADLRNADQATKNTGFVQVVCNTALGDGGHGFFRYTSGQSAGYYTDDNGITILPTNSNGSSAWLRDYTGDIHLSWFLGSASDATDALQDAIWAAAEGELGRTVFIDMGVYNVSETIILPNRVALKGANGRGAVILASSSFQGQSVFYAHNGTTSMFGSFISDMMIDANGHADYCVLADAWQETCGMARVVLTGFKHTGLLLQYGYGGASYTTLTDIEIFGTYSTAQYGIRVNQISSVGGFMLKIDGASITGENGNQLPAAIVMVNDSLVSTGLHFEYADIGVYMLGKGTLGLNAVTGSFNNTDPNAVQYLVAFGSSFEGTANLSNLMPNGIHGYTVRDCATGYNVDANEGNIAQYLYGQTYSY